MCAGNIRVYCRIKPVPSSHRSVLRQGALCDGEDRKVLVQHPRTGREQKFNVDHVFPGLTTQGEPVMPAVGLVHIQRTDNYSFVSADTKQTNFFLVYET